MENVIHFLHKKKQAAKPGGGGVGHENYSASYVKHNSEMDSEDMLPHKEMGQLTFEEKKFLLAVERGDVATTRRYAQQQNKTRVSL